MRHPISASVSGFLIAFGASSAFAKVTGEELSKLAKRIRVGITEQAIVKVVYDVKAKSKQKVHFLDTNKFAFHIDYVKARLGYSGSEWSFNSNYAGDLVKREYALVTIVLPETASGQALLEPWNGDTIDADGLRQLERDIQAELPQGLELKIHPLGLDQEKLVTENFDPSEYVLTKDLIGDVPFIAHNEGRACGYLRFTEIDPKTGAPGEMEMTDIAVFDRVPNDLGLVAGVVTAEIQTPLSHVNVKSMNRGTANMYIKDAKTVLAPYRDAPVEIIAKGSDYAISRIPVADAERVIAECWQEKRPKLNGKPTFILDPQYDTALMPLYTLFASLPSREVHQQVVQKVGAKAANLGLLNQVLRKYRSERLQTPETIGIPFNHYEQFMNLRQKGLDLASPQREMTPLQRITELLNRSDLLNPQKVHRVSVVRPALAEIRDVIKRSQVPKQLIDLLRAEIENPASPISIEKIARLRLRSSTNSEDLEGFTGAGLYDSLGVNLYKKKNGTYDRKSRKSWNAIEKDLREGIASLYSSVWNERAFLEREWYSMNGLQHLDIKVGLAVHSAFPKEGFDGEPGEIANGVAVTTNLYKVDDIMKVYFNAQHWDLAVTNPPTPEELTEVGEDPSKPYVTEETLVTGYLADPKENSKKGAWMKWPVQRLRSTSVKGGEPVLKTKDETASGCDELRELASYLRYVHDQLARVYQKDPNKFAIDVEWKIQGSPRTLIIKQARPFAAPGLD